MGRMAGECLGSGQGHRGSLPVLLPYTVDDRDCRLISLMTERDASLL